MTTLHLAVNGHSYTVDADPQTSLLTVLREHLDLTGSKYGCGEGQCGACTVLIDGKAQRSCITRVGAVSQKQITTIEGIAHGGQKIRVCQHDLRGISECGKTGYPHPHRDAALTNYTGLLAEMGKGAAEIKTALAALRGEGGE